MKRLSALDALFLYMETPETPMHVASLTIFKPSGPQEGQDLFTSAFARTPRLGSISCRPIAADSSRRRSASIIRPGSWRTRSTSTTTSAMRRCRNPAAWRSCARSSGSFMQSRSTGSARCGSTTSSRDSRTAASPSTSRCIIPRWMALPAWRPSASPSTSRPMPSMRALPPRMVPPDAEPNDFIEMTSTAIGDFIRQGVRTVKSLPGVARSLTKAAPNFSRDARFLYRYLSEMPRTPFNKAISTHRVYATASLPFPEVRALARSRGVTVNDIVLALTAGALRRYLIEHCGAAGEGPRRRRAGLDQTRRRREAQQSGGLHPLAAADRRRRAAAAPRSRTGGGTGGQEPVRRHARPLDDRHFDPRRAARRHGTRRGCGPPRAAPTTSGRSSMW